MVSYYDGLKYVYRELWRLNASAQLVILHLYHLNNGLGNSGYLQVSDRDLMERTNIKSRETITRVKAELQRAGLIAYETQSTNPRAGTRYEILFYTRGACETSCQLSVQSSVQSEEFLLTRARKTKEPPTPPPPAPIDNSTISQFDERTTRLADEMDELIDAWREDPQMPNLYFEQESKLREMVKKGEVTVEDLARAITNAKERNSPDAYGHRGINFNFVLSQLKRKETKRKVYRVKSTVVRRPDKYSAAKEVSQSAAAQISPLAKVALPLTQAQMATLKAEVATLAKAEAPLTQAEIPMTKVEVPTLTKVEVPTLAKAEVPTLAKAEIPLAKAQVPLAKAEIPLAKAEAPTLAEVPVRKFNPNMSALEYALGIKSTYKAPPKREEPPIKRGSFESLAAKLKLEIEKGEQKGGKTGI